MKNFTQILLISYLAAAVVGSYLYGERCTVNTDCAIAANLQCMDEKCDCLPGHTVDRLSTCRKTYGGACEHVLDCNIDAFLKCNTTIATCDCQQPEQQIFNAERQACVSLLGFSCSHDSEAEFPLLCVEGAFCDMPIIEGFMYHECKCKDGWDAMEDKTCQKRESTENLFGEHCTVNTDCAASANLQCVDEKCDCLPGHTVDRLSTCRKTYGGACEHVLDCNIDAFLKCNTTIATCDCQQPEQQIFNAERQACVSLLGFSCSHDSEAEFPLLCVEGAFCDMPIIEGFMYHECKCKDGWDAMEDKTCQKRESTENLFGEHCTVNTDCAGSANLQCVDEKCDCLPGHTVDRLRTCRKSYGGACEHVLDCNIDAFLKCNTTIATCDCQQPEQQIFNAERQACVSLLGFSCSHDSEAEFPLLCVEGAFCDMPIIEGFMYHECKCKDGWEAMEDKTCQKRESTENLFGEHCTVNTDCAASANLQCVDEKCDCLPGHTVDRLRTCRKTYGGACEHVLDCNIDTFLKCNSTTATCDCQQPEQQIFDAERQACVSLLGFSCSHDSEAEFPLFCVEGAFCDMPIIEGFMYHECKCKDGWEAMEDKTCQKRESTENLFGEHCTVNTDCVASANLQCVDEKCDCLPGHTVDRLSTCRKTYGGACEHVLDCNIDAFLKCNTTIATCDCQQPEQQIFNAERQACVSLLGFSCSHDSEAEFPLLCVEGAFCDMPIIEGFMYHECKCKDGWDAMEDKTCQKRESTENLFGEHCTVNTDCAGSANLQCVDEKCDCLPGHTVDRLRTCRKSYGGACEHVLDCNIDAFLKCNTTIATCDCQQPEQQIFNAERQACVSLLGFSCSHDSEAEFPLLCVEGAFCDMPIIEGFMYHECKCKDGWEAMEDKTCQKRESTENLFGEHCTVNTDCAASANLQCVDEKCDCLPGHTVDRLRTCRKTYGGACEHVLDCNIDTFLKCNSTTATCDCQQPEQQIFDAERQACVSLLGFSCSHDSEAEFPLFCVEGAFCDMPIIEGFMYHECKCKDGWEAMEDKTCQKRESTENLFGEHCTVNTDCVASANLQCVDEKCDCLPGHTVDRLSTCRKTYGGACEHVLDCNIDAFLKCNTTIATCDCQQTEQQIFNAERQACVSLLGFSCSHDSEAEFPLLCVEGAFCDMPIIEGFMYHECKCKDGWEAMENKTCRERENMPNSNSLEIIVV